MFFRKVRRSATAELVRELSRLSGEDKEEAVKLLSKILAIPGVTMYLKGDRIYTPELVDHPDGAM